jgi:hypothetical protein
MWPETGDLRREGNALAVAESRLAEIDELIDEAESEIESLRSREQSAPLQKGCAFFGLFTMVLIVIALFVILGRGYIGGRLFFASVAAVILLGLARMRRKLVTATQTQEATRDRVQTEEALHRLRAERDRIQNLKAILSAQDPVE